MTVRTAPASRFCPWERKAAGDRLSGCDPPRKEASARKRREGDKACNQQTRNHGYDTYKQNASHGRSADFTPLFSPTRRQQVAREQNETCACKFRRRFIFTGL